MTKPRSKEFQEFIDNIDFDACFIIDESRKLKVGDEIQLFGNSYMRMMGIPLATGTVTQVRKPGDGFVFDCKETKSNETIEDDDGEIRIL